MKQCRVIVYKMQKNLRCFAWKISIETYYPVFRYQSLLKHLAYMCASGYVSHYTKSALIGMVVELLTLLVHPDIHEYLHFRTYPRIAEKKTGIHKNLLIFYSFYLWPFWKSDCNDGNKETAKMYQIWTM